MAMEATPSLRSTSVAVLACWLAFEKLGTGACALRYATPVCPSLVWLWNCEPRVAVLSLSLSASALLQAVRGCETGKSLRRRSHAGLSQQEATGGHHVDALPWRLAKSFQLLDGGLPAENNPGAGT